MAHDWAEVRAMMSGTTPAEELQKLAERNEMKWEAMGREVGTTYQAVIAMCRRHGYIKPKYSAFEFRGKTACMLEHCRDHDIPASTVYGVMYRSREKTGKLCGQAWALEKCLAYREWRKS